MKPGTGNNLLLFNEKISWGAAIGCIDFVGGFYV
jgi:hypothetical protein